MFYRTLKPFKYHEPTSIEEVVQILSVYGDKASILAGGVFLLYAMRLRKIEPRGLVNIQRIPDLDYIEADQAKGLRIGALTTLRSLEHSGAIQRDYLHIYEAVHQIGSIQVKNMGSVVGNLCVGTPASDIAPPLLVLGADLNITGSVSSRTQSLDTFFLDVNKTILQPDEIVTEIVLPSLPEAAAVSFQKLTRTKDDISKVNASVMMVVENNICSEAKIALGSVAPTPIRAKKAEEILKGEKLEEKIIVAAAEAAAEEAKPITDIRSTADYRKEMVTVLVKRAIKEALKRKKA